MLFANGAGVGFDLAVGGEIPETRPGPDTDRLGDLGRLDIFAGPVETRPREELRAAKLDAGGHAKPVQIDLIQPLRRDGAFSTGRESCRTMKLNSGDTVRPPRREPIATGFAAERDAQHEANLTERGHRP